MEKTKLGKYLAFFGVFVLLLILILPSQMAIPLMVIGLISDGMALYFYNTTEKEPVAEGIPVNPEEDICTEIIAFKRDNADDLDENLNKALNQSMLYITELKKENCSIPSYILDELSGSMLDYAVMSHKSVQTPKCREACAQASDTILDLTNALQKEYDEMIEARCEDIEFTGKAIDMKLKADNYTDSVDDFDME